MAEHKLEWVATFADRVIALAGGEIVLAGRPDEVLASPLLEEFHIGRTRYTAVTRRAKAQGLWPAWYPPSVTIDEAEAGFRVALDRD
jgi:energy-coupling factor transporter ATP-binding protein EcfA2